jgi:Fe-S-cluster containining protein
MHIPENWEKLSLEKQKDFKYMLQKGNKNKILKALPSLHQEAFKTINCLECGNCCKSYSPRFKQPDIKRIAKHLKMKEGDFAKAYLKLDEENDYVLLKQPCPFLGEDNYCSIYDLRPSDCRRYPYTDEDVIIKRIPLTLKNATSCPAVFGVLKALESIKP